MKTSCAAHASALTTCAYKSQSGVGRLWAALRSLALLALWIANDSVPHTEEEGDSKERGTGQRGRVGREKKSREEKREEDTGGGGVRWRKVDTTVGRTWEGKRVVGRD